MSEDHIPDYDSDTDELELALRLSRLPVNESDPGPISEDRLPEYESDEDELGWALALSSIPAEEFDQNTARLAESGSVEERRDLIQLQISSLMDDLNARVAEINQMLPSLPTQTEGGSSSLQVVTPSQVRKHIAFTQLKVPCL